MQTFGQRLDARQGLAPGFDFLRLALAFSVVGYHAPAVVAGVDVANAHVFAWAFHYFVLASFFSLSGFLIAGSAMRLSLSNFLINRGLRIVPALGVEVLLCAFVLGPLFTSLTLGAYLSHPGTWHYLTNIVGWLNFFLPGVFENHPTAIVNNSLWTVPHEIGCYAIMSGYILFKCLRRPWLIVASIAAFLLAGVGVTVSGMSPDDGLLQKAMHRVFVGPAARLYVLFMAGILVYLWRDKIPYRRDFFCAAITLVLIVAWARDAPLMTGPVIAALLAMPIAYITGFLGATDLWLPSFLRRGDYSYGIYLFGWPLQQVLVALLPGLQSSVAHFFLSLPLIVVFAAFSWHCIERPILQLRKKFSFVARVRLAEEAPATVDPPGIGARLDPGSKPQ